jgi:hypothetical protein
LCAVRMGTFAVVSVCSSLLLAVASGRALFFELLSTAMSVIIRPLPPSRCWEYKRTTILVPPARNYYHFSLSTAETRKRSRPNTSRSALDMTISNLSCYRITLVLKISSSQCPTLYQGQILELQSPVWIAEYEG